MMFGLKRNDIEFCVSRLPGRRKPCLMVEHENAAYKLGQFNDMECAEEFFAILDYVCFGNNEDKAREIIKRWKGNVDQ